MLISPPLPGLPHTYPSSIYTLKRTLSTNPWFSNPISFPFLSDARAYEQRARVVTAMGFPARALADHARAAAISYGVVVKPVST